MSSKGTDAGKPAIADAPIKAAPAFTPGPWQVAGTRHSGDLKLGPDARLHMVGPDGDPVAGVFFDMRTGRGFADARLISAAPDLLEACVAQHQAIDILLARLIELAPSFRPSQSAVWPMLLQGNAALLKATGGQS